MGLAKPIPIQDWPNCNTGQKVRPKTAHLFSMAGQAETGFLPIVWLKCTKLQALISQAKLWAF